MRRPLARCDHPAEHGEAEVRVLEPRSRWEPRTAAPPATIASNSSSVRSRWRSAQASSVAKPLVIVSRSRIVIARRVGGRAAQCDELGCVQLDRIVEPQHARITQPQRRRRRERLGHRRDPIDGVLVTSPTEPDATKLAIADHPPRHGRAMVLLGEGVDELVDRSWSSSALTRSAWQSPSRSIRSTVVGYGRTHVAPRRMTGRRTPTSCCSNNAAYAAAFDDDHLPVRPQRRLAVVACMDSRMDIFEMLGLRHGEAHVIRNAGGVITDDVIRSLCVSQRFLGTREIILLHHTDCGLQTVDEDGSRTSSRPSSASSRSGHWSRSTTRSSTPSSRCGACTCRRSSVQGRHPRLRLRRRHRPAARSRALTRRVRRTSGR